MTLMDAPFRKTLLVCSLSRFSQEELLVLLQLGIEPGEELEKMHVAPLGDPMAVRIGEQMFSLRADVCSRIDVECAP